LNFPFAKLTFPRTRKEEEEEVAGINQKGEEEDGEEEEEWLWRIGCRSGKCNEAFDGIQGSSFSRTCTPQSPTPGVLFCVALMLFLAFWML